MKLQPLHTFFVVLLVPLAGQAVQSEPSVEVLIPKGMPIKMEIQRDLTESQIVKYIIRRTVPRDSRQAKITTVMLDRNDAIKFSSPRVGNNLTDPMSIATADTSVTRILLIVEWLETNKGKWVMDTETGSVGLNVLIKHGARALPRSKFVPKK